MDCCEWIRPADPASRHVLRLRLGGWLDRQVAAPALGGLAANPAAPAGVLLELVEAFAEAVPPAFRRRHDLPGPVVAAMLASPVPRVRAALAANPFADPSVRARLADDPHSEVAAQVREDRDLPLPDRVLRRDLDRLYRHFTRGLMTIHELGAEVADAVHRDRRLLDVAVRHPAPGIRIAALSCFSSSGPGGEAHIEALSHDDDAAVRDTAAVLLDLRADWQGRAAERADLKGNGYDIRHVLSHRRLSRALVDELVAENDPHSLDQIVVNPSTPADVVELLTGHESAQVRVRLAARADLTAGQLARLAADPDREVRTVVSVHPALTEQQRAAITDIDLSDVKRPEEPDYTWAESVNPLLRRRAALDPRLPASMARVLAGDPDAVVRSRLARRHPDAPPELLLRVFREDPGCVNRQLPLLPNFPIVGLAGLADDPEPRVRALVAMDPQAPVAVIDRMTADPEPAVRQAMAACPRLPVERIVALLDDPELAGAAAANPALPQSRMWRLLAA